MIIKVGIIGGAGYTGGELIRLLLYHPDAEITFIHSRSNPGKLVSTVHPDLIGDTELKFTDDLSPVGAGGIEVLFLCLGHGESKKFLSENNIPEKLKVIDLTNDFRLNKDASYQLPVTGNQKPATKNFIYGLPELNRDKIKHADNTANPGCFATCIQLGLLPLAKAGLLKDVYTTGITGSTGAGQGFSQTTHFSWRANNIQAYKSLTHQHLAEIYQSLHQLQNNFPSTPSAGTNGVKFIPWRGDFTRGIFVSSQLTCNASLDELNLMYEEFYKDDPFVQISKNAISLKQVVNTNKCIIQLEKEGNTLVVHSIIDNLIKGASGQAVQNMNLMFGLDEKKGLQLKGVSF